MQKYEWNNKTFATVDKTFQKACEIANVKTTGRQASKYRNKKGIAFTFKTEAIQEMKKDAKKTE